MPIFLGGGGEMNLGPDGDLLHPLHQPTGTSRPDGSLINPISPRTGKQFQTVRPRHQLAYPWRTDISRRINQTAKQTGARNPASPSKPVHVGPADENFHMSASLVEQRPGLKG